MQNLPIPVVEMEKKFQEIIFGNKIEGKFSYERQAEKLTTNYKLYRPQNIIYINKIIILILLNLFFFEIIYIKI